MKDSAHDLLYFIHMIEILSFVYEILALRNELLNLNVGQIDIEGVEMLEISNRINLVNKENKKTEELYTKDDLLNLDPKTFLKKS